MMEFIAKLPEYLSMGAQILAGLVVVATTVARITPSAADNATVKKYADMILKVISYLPTLGVNPKTKELEKAYSELMDK